MSVQGQERLLAHKKEGKCNRSVLKTGNGNSNTADQSSHIVIDYSLATEDSQHHDLYSEVRVGYAT
jgi:hypothetical protein